MEGFAEFVRDLALTGFLFILPGWALLRLLPPVDRMPGAVRLGLSPALSLAVQPLLFLSARLLQIRVTPMIAALPGILATVALVVAARRTLLAPATWRARIRASLRRSPSPDLLVFGLLLGVIFAVRWIVALGLPAPAWGDSVHHTMIVRLLLENGGLFSSWEPYAPMTTFSYHFGFHSAAASWALVGGASATQAVLASGQALNALAALVLYPVGARLGRSRWTGVAAVAVAGLFSVIPAFTVNWGRYTQLAGQVILPAVIWFFISAWRDARAKPRSVAFLAILLAGLFLSHYRVAVVSVSAAAAWALRALWDHRRNIKDWVARAWRFTLAGIGAILLLLPWIPAILSGRTPSVISRAMDTSKAAAPTSDFFVWANIEMYLPDAFWIAGLLALGAALVWNRKLAADLVLWCGLAFLLANLHLLGLPGSAVESNFILLAGLYVPVAWLVGWVAGEAAGFLDRAAAGRLVLAAGIVLAFGFGAARQVRIVDPFFQMVTNDDVEAFRWIRGNTPKSARFLTNAFPAFAETIAVGSDAGWWLPYYTRRSILFLPLQSGTEQLPDGFEQRGPRSLLLAVRETGGAPEKFNALFRREGMTHVFLGAKRGTVGYGAVELVPESWLRENPAFTRLARFGQAQVWRFDPER